MQTMKGKKEENKEIKAATWYTKHSCSINSEESVELRRSK